MGRRGSDVSTDLISVGSVSVERELTHDETTSPLLRLLSLMLVNLFPCNECFSRLTT